MWSEYSILYDDCFFFFLFGKRQQSILTRYCNGVDRFWKCPISLIYWTISHCTPETILSNFKGMNSKSNFMPLLSVIYLWKNIWIQTWCYSNGYGTMAGLLDEIHVFLLKTTEETLIVIFRCSARCAGASCSHLSYERPDECSQYLITTKTDAVFSTDYLSLEIMCNRGKTVTGKIHTFTDYFIWLLQFHVVNWLKLIDEKQRDKWIPWILILTW